MGQESDFEEQDEEDLENDEDEYDSEEAGVVLNYQKKVILVKKIDK